ncbi:putative Secreted Protein [Cryptosporidium tyzzeri]|nr:putative Secreted Protein [Cryptosporidium tyzzeri]
MKFDTKVTLFVLFSLSLFSVLSSANISNDDGEDIPKNVEKSVINKFSGLNLNGFEAELCMEILIKMMLIIYTFILRCNAVFNPEESIESVSKLILLYIDKHSRFSDRKKMISPSRLKDINKALKPLIETDLMYQMENSSKLDTSIFVVVSERLNEITSILEILSELLKLMIIKEVSFGYNVVAKKNDFSS